MVTHHPHNHDHAGHNHSHTPKNFDRAFIVGLVLNMALVVTELVFGILANSVSLIADAGHNFSDVLGLLLAWIASILVRRQRSSRYTYGWRKSSILAAFLNGIFLLVATGSIIWEAIGRLLHPGEVDAQVVIIVAGVGLLINAGTALMFMSGGKGDINIRAAFLHLAADALVSLGVVLAGIGILLTGWLWLDPAFSLIVSALLIFSTWELLKESFNLAIDGVPNTIEEPAVRTYLTERPGVTQVHDLHIWSMSTTETVLTAHLVIPTGHPGDGFLAEISEELQEHFGIKHATIQIETGDQNYPCTLKTGC